MRMADNRSLLGSLANFASALLLLCPATWGGAIGGGRGGGGGPGGGGTGGSGCLGAKCKSPLCGIGGRAPTWKPKAVWVDWGGGMCGPGVGGGGGLELVCREGKRITVQRYYIWVLLRLCKQQTNALVICRWMLCVIGSVCALKRRCAAGYSLVVDINAVVFMLHRW